MVDATGLNPVALKTACGFESHFRHQPLFRFLDAHAAVLVINCDK